MEKMHLLLSTKFPAAFKQALEITMSLIGMSLSQINNPPYPLEGEGETYEAALNVVQSALKEEWVLAARRNWLKMAILKWETFTNLHVSEGDLNQISWVLAGEEIGVRVLTIESYLTVGHLGGDCKRLMDRFLKVLSLWHQQGRHRESVRGVMVQLLKRRTGNERENDPHRDSLAFELLMEHYGLA